MTIRVTEADLANDLHALLVKVQEGIKLIVEQDHRTVAVIRSPKRPGRKLSECIAAAKSHEETLGFVPVPDLELAADMQAGIDAHTISR